MRGIRDTKVLYAYTAFTMLLLLILTLLYEIQNNPIIYAIGIGVILGYIGYAVSEVFLGEQMTDTIDSANTEKQ